MKKHPLGGLSLLAAASLLVSLSGCTSRPTITNHMDNSRLVELQELVIEVDGSTSKLNVDYGASELNLNIPVAAVTAAQLGAAASDRESAAAAGIVGTLIGVQLARAAHQTRLQNEANKPVTALKASVEGKAFNKHVNDALHEKLAEHLEEEYRIKSKGAGTAEAILRITPIVALTADLRALWIQANVIVTDARDAKVIYSREFAYYDESTTNQALPPEELARVWVENENVRFWQRLDASLNGLAKVIAGNLRSTSGVRYGGAGAAIRYRNERGQFYERGHLLAQAEGRLLIQTLRGGILSVPGALVE